MYRDLGVFKSGGSTNNQISTLNKDLFQSLPGGFDGIGSNNWVVSGDKTISGKPLLANDPHLGLTSPAIWYFAHIEAPKLQVIGATVPGIPGVVLGRNTNIAWGFTNTDPDVQDLYIEALDKRILRGIKYPTALLILFYEKKPS